MRVSFLWALSLLCVWCMPHYTVENWVDTTTVDSVEYQLILPLSALHGKEGRQRDLQAFQSFLKGQLGKDKVKRAVDKNIRQVTLFDISLMDPTQNQDEEETEWELKLRTVIDGKKSTIGQSDLTVKRGAVPAGFDWYPDHATVFAASATSVENKYELDIQCAERDYTQATKFEFARGIVPFLFTYDDLKLYFPKLFQTHELQQQLAKTPNYLKSLLPVAEISFEWDAEVQAEVEGVEVTFLFGTRHSSLENAREGEEGWAIRPPELNFRVKRSALTSVTSSETKFLSEMDRIFNALLDSQWNGHQDCDQWNGAKSCAPGFKLSAEGECEAEGCGPVVEAVTKIPRGAGAMPPLTAGGATASAAGAAAPPAHLPPPPSSSGARMPPFPPSFPPPPPSSSSSASSPSFPPPSSSSSSSSSASAAFLASFSAPSSSTRSSSSSSSSSPRMPSSAFPSTLSSSSSASLTASSSLSFAPLAPPAASSSTGFSFPPRASSPSMPPSPLISSTQWSAATSG